MQTIKWIVLFGVLGMILFRAVGKVLDGPDENDDQPVSTWDSAKVWGLLAIIYLIAGTMQTM